MGSADVTLSGDETNAREQAVEPARRSVTAFADRLTAHQRRRLFQPTSSAASRGWSNLPQAVLGGQGRLGLSTSTLSTDQWEALWALLETVAGSGVDAGAGRIREHLAADDYLLSRGGIHGYGRGEFVIAVFGDPAAFGDPDAGGRWQLQFGGHHLAVIRTYERGALIGATPAFRGIEPFTAVECNGRINDPERRLRHSARSLLSGLDAEQARRSSLVTPMPDLLLGPGRDGPFPPRPDGLPVCALRPRQQRQLLDLISAFVDDVADDDAAPILDRYRQELPSTFLARTGSLGLNRVGDYLRIDGPRVWIEISIHEGIVLSGPHPHAVWRDKLSDYGGF